MFNGKCPFDIHWYIYNNFLDIEDKKNVKLLNKDFYEFWKRDVDNGRIIKKYLIKYCKIDDEYLNCNFIIEPFHGYKYNYWNVNKIYRYYIQKYEMKYLLSYPEFLTKKAILNYDKREKTLKWINDNLDKNIDKRNRRDILRFFKENEITIKELLYAGM